MAKIDTYLPPVSGATPPPNTFFSLSSILGIIKFRFSTPIDLNPRFGGPLNMLEIFLVNFNFIMLQKKSFGLPKEFARIEKLPK